MCYFSSDAPSAGNRVSIQANLENEANSTKPLFEFILNVPSRFGRLDDYPVQLAKRRRQFQLGDQLGEFSLLADSGLFEVQQFDVTRPLLGGVGGGR